MAAAAIGQGNLRDAYQEIRKKDGLADLIRKLRNKRNVRTRELTTFFENAPTWIPKSIQSGHKQFVNEITGVKVNFQGHYVHQKDDSISYAVAVNILESLQTHVNVLGNEIFDYGRNYKNEPDFRLAEQNYLKFKGVKTEEDGSDSD